ncbi:hotdog fold thioesterase [Bdellovibrio sp. HCB337]|uniref:hotdog fold thioesterase n=1 Tax=Bdellovibrio sp. HCB337 TaxID=3394358 RepID=UPI0039A6C378
MIWTKKPDLESLKKASANTMVDHLGIEFTEIGDDYLIAKMPVDHRTKQPAGLLHGGASVTLAETMGSIASVFCLPTQNKMPVGIEINANHLKSATSGFVWGKVTPIRVGQSLHVWNIEIHNDKKETVCVSRLTVMIVDRK